MVRTWQNRTRAPNRSSTVSVRRTKDYGMWRPVASLAFGVRRRHDWHPAGNFALNQYRERLLTSCGLGRYIAADVEQALTHAGVIQCLVEGIAEHVANRLRRAFRGKQRKPRCRLKFRQPGLF